MIRRLLLVLSVFGPILSIPSNRGSQAESSDSYCYLSDDEPYLFFSSETAYDYTHGDISEDEVPETCTPVQFWAVNRHGTRYPEEDEIATLSNLGSVLDEVIRNYEEGRTSLCKEDFHLLKTWKWDASIDESVAKDLAPQGFEDLKGIAKRFKQKFPEVFITPYKKKNYYFQYTKSSRTKDSFQGYVEGLFGSDCDVDAKESNKVIKEYKKCTTWGDEDFKEEYRTFIETSQYQAMVSRVSSRLGFQENLNVSLIEALYIECAFETAWYLGDISKWCIAFTEEDLLVLEYSEDLKTYYESGYGREEANKALGCPILNDLFTRFENTINGDSDEPKATVLFTHSASLDQFMVNLELHKDEQQLTGYNYAQQAGRKWRSSLFGQFATNVAAVLYKCSDTKDPYQIEFFVDERPESICSQEKLCSWAEFVDKFEKTAQSCNLDFCEAKAAC